MTTHVTGTLLDRVIHLDHAVEFPANTRVSVAIQPLSDSTANAIAAWEAMKQRIAARPIRSGGRRFTRDELHERR